MRNKELQARKIKRVLIYWDYLSKLRVETQTAIDFISYIFSIKEQWILKIIRTRSLDEPELSATELPDIDIELNMIDAFHRKLLKQARKDRSK